MNTVETLRCELCLRPVEKVPALVRSGDALLCWNCLGERAAEERR